MIIDERSYALEEELYLKFGERPKLTKQTKPKKGVVYELTPTQRAYLKGLYGVSPSKDVECIEECGEATWQVGPKFVYDEDGNQHYLGWQAFLAEPVTLKCRWRSLGYSTPTGKLQLTVFAMNPSELPDEPLKNEPADEGRPNRKVKKTKTKLSLDLSIFDS